MPVKCSPEFNEQYWKKKPPKKPQQQQLIYLDVQAHTSNPSTWEAEREDLWEFCSEIQRKALTQKEKRQEYPKEGRGEKERLEGSGEKKGSER